MDHLIDLGLFTDTTEGGEGTSRSDSPLIDLSTDTSTTVDTQVTNLSLPGSPNQPMKFKVSGTIASQLGLLRIKEEEVKIKRERLKLKDKALELDLELAEARRKVIEAELGMTSSGQDKAMTSSIDLDDFQQASPGTSQNHFDKLVTPDEGMHTLGSA